MTKDHIIAKIIEERAPKISNSKLWPILRPLVHFIMGYKGAVEFADKLRNLEGLEALSFVSQTLSLDLAIDGIERIPKTGALIIVSNHPSGVSDAIAIREALMQVRKDLVFFANADTLRICPNLRDDFIPIVWLPERRTYHNSKHIFDLTAAALKQNKAIIIFPAGRMARYINGIFQDLPWSHTFVKMAKIFNVPILPVYIVPQYSILQKIVGKYFGILRDISVFRELKNNFGKKVRIEVRNLVVADNLSANLDKSAAQIKEIVELNSAHSWQMALTEANENIITC